MSRSRQTADPFSEDWVEVKDQPVSFREGKDHEVKLVAAAAGSEDTDSACHYWRLAEAMKMQRVEELKSLRQVGRVSAVLKQKLAANEDQKRNLILSEVFSHWRSLALDSTKAKSSAFWDNVRNSTAWDAAKTTAPDDDSEDSEYEQEDPDAACEYDKGRLDNGKVDSPLHPPETQDEKSSAVSTDTKEENQPVQTKETEPYVDIQQPTETKPEKQPEQRETKMEKKVEEDRLTALEKDRPIVSSPVSMAGLEFGAPELAEWRQWVNGIVFKAEPEQVWLTSSGNRSKWRLRLHELLKKEYPEMCKKRELQEVCHAGPREGSALEKRGAFAYARGAEFETGMGGGAGGSASTVCRDMPMAFAHYVESLFCGHPAAMVKVAEFYIQGYHTVKIDVSFAKMLLYEAWRRGERLAASWLSRVLTSPNNHWHVNSDTKSSAQKWLLAALKRECPIAIGLTMCNYQNVGLVATDFLITDAPFVPTSRIKKAADCLTEKAVKKATDWLYDSAWFYPDCAFLNTLYVYAATLPDKREKDFSQEELMAQLQDPLSSGHAEANYWMSRAVQSPGCALSTDDEENLRLSIQDKGQFYELPSPHFLQAMPSSSSIKGNVESSVNAKGSIEMSSRFLKQAANQHLPDAMADWSTCQLVGCPRFTEGFAWAERAAERLAPAGFWNLALCFAYGWGCAGSAELALLYLRLAHCAGHRRATDLVPLWTAALRPLPAACFTLA